MQIRTPNPNLLSMPKRGRNMSGWIYFGEEIGEAYLSKCIKRPDKKCCTQMLSMFTGALF